MRIFIRRLLTLYIITHSHFRARWASFKMWLAPLVAKLAPRHFTVTISTEQPFLNHVLLVRIVLLLPVTGIGTCVLSARSVASVV